MKYNARDKKKIIRAYKALKIKYPSITYEDAAAIYNMRPGTLYGIIHPKKPKVSKVVIAEILAQTPESEPAATPSFNTSTVFKLADMSNRITCLNQTIESLVFEIKTMRQWFVKELCLPPITEEN